MNITNVKIIFIYVQYQGMCLNNISHDRKMMEYLIGFEHIKITKITGMLHRNFCMHHQKIGKFNNQQHANTVSDTDQLTSPDNVTLKQQYDWLHRRPTSDHTHTHRRSTSDHTHRRPTSEHTHTEMTYIWLHTHRLPLTVSCFEQ